MDEKLLTSEEAADFLRMTTRTLYRLVASNKIPYMRLPTGGLRFLKDDLKKWLKGHGKNS